MFYEIGKYLFDEPAERAVLRDDRRIWFCCDCFFHIRCQNIMEIARSIDGRTCQTRQILYTGMITALKTRSWLLQKRLCKKLQREDNKRNCRSILIDALEWKFQTTIISVFNLRGNMKTFRICLCVWVVLFFVAIVVSKASGEDKNTDLFKWFVISGNFDSHFSKTQFDANNHNAVVGQWDIRLGIEPPSWTNTLVIDPYIRFAGIAASKNPAWENGLLASPGYGLEIFPFSWSGFQQGEQTPWIIRALGPLRLYGEYNTQDYWGIENSWRPKHQIRVGAEYWQQRYANDTTSSWWTEFWAGGWWQSANEFDAHYDAWITAQSFRGGLRIPNAKVLSWFTPYVLAESSLTDHKSYYWENRLDLGGGLRIAPDLKDLGCVGKFVNHFAIYAEYLHKTAYYGSSAPASIPNYDCRVGITFSIGSWYRDVLTHRVVNQPKQGSGSY